MIFYTFAELSLLVTRHTSVAAILRVDLYVVARLSFADFENLNFTGLIEAGYPVEPKHAASCVE